MLTLASQFCLLFVGKMVQQTNLPHRRAIHIFYQMFDYWKLAEHATFSSAVIWTYQKLTICLEKCHFVWIMWNKRELYGFLPIEKLLFFTVSAGMNTI